MRCTAARRSRPSSPTPCLSAGRRHRCELRRTAAARPRERRRGARPPRECEWQWKAWLRESSIRRVDLTRRRLIRLAAYAVTLPGALEFFHPWLHAAGGGQHYAPPDPGKLRDYEPKFFGADDFAALEAFTAILIPTDDTPGAREARCAHFIDFLLQASESI